MEETHHQQTDSSTQHWQPTMRLRMSAVPTGKPGAKGDPGGFDATENELLHLLQCLLPLTGENLDQWSLEERRDFLNWCLDEGVLTIQDGRLVPVEELVPTAPLTHDTDVDAHNACRTCCIVARSRTHETCDRYQARNQHERIG